MWRVLALAFQLHVLIFASLGGKRLIAERQVFHRWFRSRFSPIESYGYLIYSLVCVSALPDDPL